MRRRRILELDGLPNAVRTRLPAVSGSAWQWGARSSASRDQLLILDEPLSNLDAKLRACECVWSCFICIVVFVPPRSMCHDQVEAMTLAQRVMVMNKERRRTD